MNRQHLHDLLDLAIAKTEQGGFVAPVFVALCMAELAGGHFAVSESTARCLPQEDGDDADRKD
jgi:hypothetical protein